MPDLYFDYNSTSPLDPRVRDALRSWLEQEWGNASAREYRMGWTASEAVEEARDAVAEFVGGKSDEIVFTSGATESICAALKSFVGYANWEQSKIVTCATEHAAVLAPCKRLQELTKVELTVLPVDRHGLCKPDDFRGALDTTKRCLVAVMAANNEIGTIHPVEELCQTAHDSDALFLCDLTQAAGKMPINLSASQFDFAAFSAHKMYGPKGVGTLMVKKDVPFEPLIYGGQERGRRSGTLNVPGIVGFGEACRIAKTELPADSARKQQLRDRLERSLLEALPDIWINAIGAPRLCNTSNIGFRGVEARTMIRDMHDIACSTKSACSSGEPGPSHVLKAIGLSDDEAYSCIRFSIGRFTTDEEIDYAIDKIIESVRKLRRNMSSHH
ncbi:MAG TPA: cysteine desulfurase family protein [Pirellula sp.]|nr:cysteine desulfurase family protein [Pirellula sp.]